MQIKNYDTQTQKELLVIKITIKNHQKQLENSFKKVGFISKPS